IGYALTEDFQVRGGLIQTRDLSTCLIPTALDLPDIESVAVDGDEPTGPRGLKGVGEVGLNGPAPALASALEDALGERLRDFPLTPERVLAALKKRKTPSRRRA
ncbi:MAG: xanthine dehydrogenase family protein molybdopterin-binding subunit, partial [Humidesulfovibrio sp.]|nr:xanthine dehydrogenase family protein molybdopterin-binding subunit [Humidesulfovibrio sp.]